MKRTAVFPWLGKNLSTLILAFILSLVVWVSAVVTADPNEEHILRAIAIEKVGQASDLLLVGDVPSRSRLTLQAPKSIWDKLNKDANLVKAWVDLSGYGAGTHTVDVKTQVDISPIRITGMDPQRIQVTLEKLATKELIWIFRSTVNCLSVIEKMRHPYNPRVFAFLVQNRWWQK